MEIAPAIIALIAIALSAFVTGLVFAEREQLANGKKALDQAVDDFRHNTEKLAATHNALVTQLQAVQDQVNSHEMKLAAGKAQQRAAWPAV